MSPRNSSEGTTFFCELPHPTDARRANENKALRISYRDAGFLDFVGRGREQRLLCRTVDPENKNTRDSLIPRVEAHRLCCAFSRAAAAAALSRARSSLGFLALLLTHHFVGLDLLFETLH